jgi:hypothetical protein
MRRVVSGIKATYNFVGGQERAKSQKEDYSQEKQAGEKVQRSI